MWDPAGVPDDAIERGAYVLQATPTASPTLILMATGSEVHIANDAPKLLEAEGVRVRLVSACRAWTASPSRTRPTATACCRRRCARASPSRRPSPLGWHRWVGDDGDVVAMEGFGASAPAKALYQHFGFTGENVAERARAVLERVERVN